MSRLPSYSFEYKSVCIYSHLIIFLHTVNFNKVINVYTSSFLVLRFACTGYFQIQRVLDLQLFVWQIWMKRLMIVFTAIAATSQSHDQNLALCNLPALMMAVMLKLPIYPSPLPFGLAALHSPCWPSWAFLSSCSFTNQECHPDFLGGSCTWPSCPNAQEAPVALAQSSYLMKC